MIIRAVSSDEEDDASSFQFPADAASRDRNDSAGISSPTAVKLAWLGVCCALIALLLVDLSALLNQILPTPATASVEPRRADPFSLLSWLLIYWRGDSAAMMQATTPATVLNNVIGQFFVCAWIYSRETALRSQRQRDTDRRRGGSADPSALLLRSLPWSVVLGVLCLGHLVSCVYTLFALFESHGGAVRTKFWLGRTSGASRTAPRV